MAEIENVVAEGGKGIFKKPALLVAAAIGFVVFMVIKNKSANQTTTQAQTVSTGATGSSGDQSVGLVADQFSQQLNQYQNQTQAAIQATIDKNAALYDKLKTDTQNNFDTVGNLIDQENQKIDKTNTDLTNVITNWSDKDQARIDTLTQQLTSSNSALSDQISQLSDTLKNSMLNKVSSNPVPSSDPTRMDIPETDNGSGAGTIGYNSNTGEWWQTDRNGDPMPYSPGGSQAVTNNIVSPSSSAYTSTYVPVTSTSVNTGEAAAVYGNNNSAYDSAAQASDQRAASDAGYRQSEIDRTNQVIANRENAGLDTSLQQTYLDKLTNMNGN